MSAPPLSRVAGHGGATAPVRLIHLGLGVQVVHPVGEQEVQGLVRDPLGDLRECRPSEDHPAAVVAGAAELCLFDGHETSRNAGS